MPQAAPPLVLRLWLDLHKVRTRNGTAAFLDLAARVRRSATNVSGLDHLFAVKVPRHMLKDLAAMLSTEAGFRRLMGFRNG